MGQNSKNLPCTKTVDMGKGGVKNRGSFADVFYVRPHKGCKSQVKISNFW